MAKTEINNIEITEEMLYEAFKISRDVVNYENEGKVELEALTRFIFRDYLKKHEQIAFEENGNNYRRELFDINCLKVGDYLINLINASSINPDELFIPQKIFNEIYADFYVPVYVNKNTGNSFILGFLSHNHIDNNSVIHDNHFYKISNKFLNPIEEIIDCLKGTKKRQVTETNTKEKTEDLEKELNELIGNIARFKDEDFISDINYVPLNWYNSLLKSELLSSLYLEAQKIFNEMNDWKLLLRLSGSIKQIYDVYKENEGNIIGIVNKTNNIINSFSRLYSIGEKDFNEFTNDLNLADFNYGKLLKIDTHTELLNFLGHSVKDLIKGLDSEEAKDIIDELGESLVSITNKLGKVFLGEELNLTFSSLSGLDINDGLDLSQIITALIQSIKDNSILGLYSFKNGLNLENPDITVFSGLMNNQEIKLNEKALKYAFTFTIKGLIKTGRLKTLARRSNSEIALIVDLSYFIVINLFDLYNKNENTNGLNELIEKIKNRNISTLVTLLNTSSSALTTVGGAEIGAILGAMFGPVGVPVGLILGSLVGEYAGNQLKEVITEDNFNKIAIQIYELISPEQKRKNQTNKNKQKN